MSKKDWIFSYIYIFLTIAVLFASFKYTGFGIIGKTVLVCLILLIPILFNFNKNKKDLTYTFGNRIAIFCGIYFLLFLTLFIGLSACSYEPNLVAITSSVEKANEIQELLTINKQVTTREIIEWDGVKYGIGLQTSGKKEYRNAVVTILNSEVLDETVLIHVNRKFSKNPQKAMKNLENGLEWIIWDGIKGVEWVSIKIELNVPFKDVRKENAKIAKVTVDYGSSDDSDYIKLNNAIKNLILHAVAYRDNPVVIIEDKNLSHKAYKLSKQAYKLFLDKNYNGAMELLKKAKGIEKYYQRDIDDLQKFIELNIEIKQNPKNYKLYIERGDLQNRADNYTMFSSMPAFTSNREGAIEDYNKALELNPKAYEVYEKRGFAWSNVNHYPDKLSTKELRYPEDDENAINDFLKAIEYTGGDDNLYNKLGDLCKDPKNKLNYYQKVQFIPEYIHTAPPNPNPPIYHKQPLIRLEKFDFNSHHFLPLKIVFCYDKLGQYDKSIRELDNIIKHNVYVEQSNNLKFYYNWKAGHYMTALKSADNCSAWICKLVGIFF